MKILVTGGAGFIASHIADAYVNVGHEVVILDNLSSGCEDNVNPKARLVKADIRDAAAMSELMNRERFDLVNHHAAQIDVRRSVADPAFDASVNLVGALTLFEACVRSGVKRIIFASSGGAIYGEQDYYPADERHPTRPISPYGVAKLSTEHYLYYYKVVHGIHSVCLRYANVYGPRQNPEGEAGVVAIFTSKMLAGSQPIINGDGKQTRDYVFVGDIVQANVLALGFEGTDSFNVGTGRESDVNTLFKILKKETQSNCAETHTEGKKGEQQRSVLDAGKLQRVLGWKPQVNIEEGLARTVAFFKDKHSHGSASPRH